MGLDLEIYKGEKRVFQFTIYDKAGVAVTLTGQTVRFRVHDDLPSSESIEKFSVDATKLDTGGTGKCNVTLTNTQTELEPGLYYYELFVIYTSDSEEYVAERGKFVILPRLEGTSMAMYITVDTVMEWLRITEDYAWDKAEVQETIEMAHRELLNNVGVYQIDRMFGHYEDDVAIYYLSHGAILELLKIRHNSDTVDSSDYTVEPRAGTVTFDSDYDITAGDSLEFWYVPRIYRDLELLYTLRLMGMRGFLQGFGDLNYLNPEKLDEQISRIESSINSKNPMGSFLDFGMRGRIPGMSSWR